MNKNLVKIELGCGPCKTEGYIGVDRFPMEGVDVVADLNQKFPFEDDSVDVVYSCHALEHLENLQHTMDEIFRVCKNKALILILAPYYHTNLNMANLYHKNVFNEDTFRVFSSYTTQRIPTDVYECPHAMSWGIKHSDNSEGQLELEIISMEFFYYEGYRHLSDEEKLRARRSLQNVCDQVLYIACANKSGTPFSEDELLVLEEDAKQYLPPPVFILRERDKHYTDKKTIYEDIIRPVVFTQQESEQRLSDELSKQSLKQEQGLSSLNQALLEINSHLASLQKADQVIVEHLQDHDRQISGDVAHLAEHTMENERYVVDQRIKIETIEHTLLSLSEHLKRVEASHNELLLGVIRENEKRSSIFNNYGRFSRTKDFTNFFQTTQQDFYSCLIQQHANLKKNAVLIPSATIPYEDYVEYKTFGQGTKLHLWLLGCYGAGVLIEMVQENVIIFKKQVFLEQQGECIIVPECPLKAGAVIRMKALNNQSIARVLLIQDRFMAIFGKNRLAAFIDER